jgi:Spy/CpxP family protein refolding chaperone
MTRRIVMAAALALSLGTTLPLVAQGVGDGVQTRQRAGGPGRGGRGGPGGPGGPMAVFPGLNRIELSETQREQVRAILEGGRQSGEPGEKMRQAEQALHAALLADAPNPQAVEAARAAVTAAQAAGLDRRIDLMQKIAQVLTPAQRQELASMPGPGGGGRNE